MWEARRQTGETRAGDYQYDTELEKHERGG